MRKSILNFPEINKEEKKKKLEKICSIEDFDKIFIKMNEIQNYEKIEKISSDFIINSKKEEYFEKIIFDITNLFFINKKNELFLKFFKKIKKVVDINKLNLEVKIFVQLYYYFSDFTKNLNFKSFFNFQEKKSRYYFLKFLKNKIKNKYPLDLKKIIKKIDNEFLSLIKNSKFNYNHFFVSLNRKKFLQIDFLNLRNIKKISNGSNHILFLTDDLKILGFGDNTKKQILPFSKNNFFKKGISLNFFYKKIKDNNNCIDIFCFDNISGCFFENYDVFFWGGIFENLIEISGLDKNYKITILKDYIIFLYEDLEESKILKIKDFQNMLEKEEKRNFHVKLNFLDLEEKKIIKKLEIEKKDFSPELQKNELKLKNFKSGQNHLLLTTKNGILLGFGENTKNQLDHSKTKFHSKLILITNFNGEKINSLFCYKNFSLVQDEFINYSIFGQFSSKTSKIKRNDKIP